MRRMSQERSSCSVTAPFAIGAQKLGHPVPELNLVLEANSGAPQHTHLNTPKRFSSLSGLEKAGSVPCCRVTRYCSGVSCCFHSSAVLRTLTGGLAGMSSGMACGLVAAGMAGGDGPSISDVAA